MKLEAVILLFGACLKEPWESSVRLSGGGENAREGRLSELSSGLPEFSVLREHRFVVVIGEWIFEPGLDDRLFRLG